MPAGVHSYDVVVSDSLKGFWLSAGAGTLLTAPVDVSANVLVPSGAARSSSVGAFTYAVSRVPFEVEAIPGVIIPQDSIKDDGYLTDVPLGFSFDFYGATYDKVNVYSNGFLQFGPPQLDPARAGFFKGGFIPSSQLPNNIIAFAWTDWSPQLVYGGIRYETRGTAPHRRFLLQFNNVPAFHSPTGTLMMQLQLNEGSNVITIYTNTLVITNSSQRITQGIENADGTAPLTGRRSASPQLWDPASRTSALLLPRPRTMEVSSHSLASEVTILHSRSMPRTRRASPGSPGRRPITTT